MEKLIEIYDTRRIKIIKNILAQKKINLLELAYSFTTKATTEDLITFSEFLLVAVKQEDLINALDLVNGFEEILVEELGIENEHN